MQMRMYKLVILVKHLTACIQQPPSTLDTHSLDPQDALQLNLHGAQSLPNRMLEHDTFASSSSANTLASLSHSCVATKEAPTS